ncbi:MAG: alginate export family protein [Glycocaulis sp.]
MTSGRGLFAAAAIWLSGAAAHPQAPQPSVELEFSGSARVRAETLGAHYRAGMNGSDQLLSTQLFLRGEARLESVTLVGELIDARGYLQDDGSVISSSAYNAADIFQLYAEAQVSSQLTAKIGRFTMPLGSGRLSDASSFSNMPANFEGVRLQLDIDENWRAIGFFTAPVIRDPADRQALADNRMGLDYADWHTRFYGAHLSRNGLPHGLRAEAYVFALDENGGARLVTPGVRLRRPPQEGQYDFDAELMLQTGHTIIGATRRDVSAAAFQANTGYTFERENPVRLSAHLSYASGDRPRSASWNRFDPLFGGRGSDYGHTGLFGPIARENLISYGARAEWSNGPVRARLVAHDVYLASRTDSWERARLRDGSGNSGRHIGQVIDTRVQWDAVPERLTVEWGAAALIKGDFARHAPGAPDTGNSLYSYLSLSTRF